MQHDYHQRTSYQYVTSYAVSLAIVLHCVRLLYQSTLSSSHSDRVVNTLSLGLVTLFCVFAVTFCFNMGGVHKCYAKCHLRFHIFAPSNNVFNVQKIKNAL
jgi:hypothetical protein